MPGTRSTAKRILLGRAFTTESLARERLPKRFALPLFSSDSLSSVGYAPDQIVLALALGGTALIALGPWVALAVVAVMAVLVAAMRTSVHEYPDGGGDYAVVRANLGQRAGRLAGASLLLDYVLTVAVSTTQAAAYLSAAVPQLRGAEVAVALLIIALLTVLALRGVRENARALALPMYLFMGSLGLLILTGGVQAALGTLGAAPSAGMELASGPGDQVTALGAVLLVTRAFAGGCAALTGVEAIGNGVPAFQPPKSRNASLTLVLMAAIGSAMLLGVVLLARATDVIIAEDPSALRRGGAAVPGYEQAPVISQIAMAVFGENSLVAVLVALITGFVLCLAANTAFQSLPQLASALAHDGYLPRQMRLRGDRLAFSNGIVLLAVSSAVAVVLTGASVTALIHVYVVGVFVAMALGQRGMVRHCTQRIRVETRGRTRELLRRRRVVSALALGVVCLVLVAVLLGKASSGGWVAVVLIAGLWVLMSLIHRHYLAVEDALRCDPNDRSLALSATQRPQRTHALVLVRELDRASMQALTTALAAQHITTEAIAVDDGEADPVELIARWRSARMPVPLRLVYSPYRDLYRPVRGAIEMLQSRNPHDGVVLYLPEVAVGHWWQWFLHNHSVRRLGRLLEPVPGLAVEMVPWTLGRAQGRDAERSSAPQDVGIEHRM